MEGIMKIHRQKALQVFQDYVSKYDYENSMIRLKVEHTYRVSSLCEQIGRSLSCSEEDIDLAWLIGLLHDIGRFEQQKKYGTFNDALSIDHAQYGADILFGSKNGNISIRDFVEDDREDGLIWAAVYYHSAYRLPQNLDERTELFCNIIRDADKIDILKVNVDFPLEEIYNVTTEELYSCQVTEEVMNSFYEEHAVLRALKKTAVDNVVGHISLVYELVFPISRQIVKEQGYLERLMNFQSQNEVAKKQFVQIREKMQVYF